MLRMTQRHTKLLLLLLLLISIASLLCSIKLGSIHTNWAMVWYSVNSTDTLHLVIWQLRWPTAITAFTAGGLLALAGALLQILLRNPMADPYILGISGGAATATLLGIILGVSSHWLHIASFGGALLAAGFVYWIAQQQHYLHPHRLLLTGMILAAGWGAVISLLLTLSPNDDLRGLLFWLLGDINSSSTPWWALIVLLLAALYSYYLAPQLNVLLRGDLAAKTLGVHVERLHWQLYLLTTLLTACAVSLAGTIGFVGLVVPHLLRLLHNSNHRFIVPGSVLLGGSLLTWASILAKQLWLPLQLPVGVVTALIGVPLFLTLLLLQKR